MPGRRRPLRTRRSLPIGLMPSSFAFSLDMSTTAAAASLRPEAFPAVTVPSFLKAVPSFAIFSRDVSMGRSSVSNRMGSPFFWGMTTGTISGFAPPFLDGLARPLMAHEAELVLLLAGDAELLGDVLRGHSHVVAVKDLPDAVKDHEIDHLRVEHAGAESAPQAGRRGPGSCSPCRRRRSRPRRPP